MVKARGPGKFCSPRTTCVQVGANVALVRVLFAGSLFFDEFVISGLDKLQEARIRLRGAVAATITKIDARQRNNPPGGVARMEADFRESEPLLQANCFSAALPGAHALGRVHRSQKYITRRAFSSKSKSAARAICWPMVACKWLAWAPRFQVFPKTCEFV